MSFIAINQIALGVFLIANMAVGWWAGRGGKTMRAYTLADKRLGVGMLVMTVIATMITGEDVPLFAAWQSGVINLLPSLCLSISSFFVGWWVWPKLVGFEKCSTIVDVMDELYGAAAGKFTILASTLFSLLIILGQLGIFGELGSMLGLSSTGAILLLGGLITLYTALGGLLDFR